MNVDGGEKNSKFKTKNLGSYIGQFGHEKMRDTVTRVFHIK